nr:HNH endonuclease [Jeotgalibacillus malaysiensis]
MCQRCKRHKILRPAKVVHHLVEVRDDWSKRLVLNNLESLCHFCHNQIHKKGK